MHSRPSFEPLPRREKKIKGCGALIETWEVFGVKKELAAEQNTQKKRFRANLSEK